MPMVWRVLATVDRLNKTRGLSIGVPEISATYNLRTYGSFRYCLQSKYSRLYMVPKVSGSDPDWKKHFFFVRRDSIPDGMNLPTKWVHKVVFEDLIKLRKDTKKRLKALFKILAEEREFWLEEETGETSVIAAKPAESMNSGMPRPKSFSLVDLDDLIEDRTVVKQEHSKTLSPSVRVPTTRQKSSAQKKRKATTSAETEPFSDMTITDAVDKLQSLANFLGTKTESYCQISQDAELSRREAEAKLIDLLQDVDTKDKILKKKDKEMSDLKASFELEKTEFLEKTKKCATANILESMIKMSEEAQAKGHVMDSWNSVAWKKKLQMLRGEKLQEDETAGTSGVIKEVGANEDVKETKAGEVTDLEKKEGDDAEGGKV